MDLDKVIKDDVERLYFKGLIEQLDVEQQSMSIHTPDQPSSLFPTAIASQELLDEFPAHNYEDIRNSYKSKDKVNATLWVKENARRSRLKH